MSSTDLEKLYVNITRLQLRILCLRDPESRSNSLNLTNLGIAAISVIGMVEQLDTEASLVLHCPHYIFRMSALAASVLLVLLRLFKQAAPNPVASGRRLGAEDSCSGENQGYKHYFFKSISLMKRMSVESNDMPSRMAKIFSQLWGSDKAFQRIPLTPSNSSNDTTSAAYPFSIQSRLSMSVLHDCMWRWREEFGYSSAEKEKNTDPSANPAESGSHNQQPSSNATLTTPASSSTTYALPMTNAVPSMGPSSLGFNGTMMTMADSFSPISPPWNIGTDQDFEMMIRQFPDSWPL